MHELNLIQKISVWILPVLFAITVHETAHGYLADRLGDRTARKAGRLTLNPLPHIDPVMTILVPTLTLLFAGIAFGSAKPVPVDWRNFKDPRKDMALVAAAGPLSNLLMAMGWLIIAKIGLILVPTVGSSSYFLFYVGVAGGFVNTVLAVINLIPVPPLDGGRVLIGFLPAPLALKVSRIEPYGFGILLLIILLPPTVLLLSKLLWGVFGLLSKAAMLNAAQLQYVVHNYLL